MPITVICDECSESHRVRDDAVGKRLKCKGCGKSLTVRAEAGSDEDLLDYEDAESDADDPPVRLRPAPKRSKSAASRTRSARGRDSSANVPLHKTSLPLGLRLVYIGFMAFVLLVFVTFGIAWTLRNNPRAVVTMLPILRGLGFLVIAANVMTSVGKVFCLTAPPQMSGRGPLLVAVVFDLCGLGLTVAGLFGAPVPRLLAQSIHLLSVIGMVCFVLFLRQFGRFLKEPDISERATGLLTLGIAVVALWVSMLVLSTLAAARVLPAVVGGLGVLVLAIALLIIGVLGVIRYAALLNSCLYAMSYE